VPDFIFYGMSTVEAVRQITKYGDGFGYDRTNTDQGYDGFPFPLKEKPRE
jgi:hypothetical protein